MTRSLNYSDQIRCSKLSWNKVDAFNISRIGLFNYELWVKLWVTLNISKVYPFQYQKEFIGWTECSSISS